MQVTFTQHAVERMQQRLRVNISTTRAINIAQGFTKSHAYTATATGRLCEAWCSNDPKMKVVLIVDCLRRAVVTVYLHGSITGLNTPFVDECYAKLAR
jgi:hypothetical protein